MADDLQVIQYFERLVASGPGKAVVSGSVGRSIFWTLSYDKDGYSLSINISDEVTANFVISLAGFQPPASQRKKNGLYVYEGAA